MSLVIKLPAYLLILVMNGCGIFLCHDIAYNPFFEITKQIFKELVAILIGI